MSKNVALVTIFFLYLTATALAAPAIEVKQPVFNFGAITEGAKIDHVFTIRNAGDAPLNILHVRPACGCTAANASSPVVQPGKTAEIKTTFNSTNFTGNITKTIALETNDPQTPNYTLTMKGVVNSEVQANPKQLNFGQVKAGTAKTLVLSVENRGKKPLKLTSVKTPMPQVVIKSENQQLRPGESGKIHITVTPRAEDRILSGYVTIATDHPTKAEIMVPVFGSPVK
ncbi:DUF1573 domain-containing protein [Geobacter sp. DSM 9736]|uniref:DUF1573 domain-containing protein n=1 Tax=Geobacter sp. DSM 9736 TaxID=1277350 RepID=UPI000B4FE6FD|nr:DUF1573 domain-containing protein [Geobacter sp. DSM 9736]SNB46020.1 Protein of unknown function [Geobacter sp. DSM 9736]